jgi:hypothetical protein
MTARKIVVPGIHGIELTQAIQVYQTLDELKRQLDRNNGSPPIPLVSYKPLAIRVVLDKVEERTDYIVEAYWNGWPLQVPVALSVSPSCLPPFHDGFNDPSSRENLAPDCRTADFFIEGPHPGTHEVRVILKSAEDEVIQDEVLHIRTKESDAVGIGVVNVCADKETDGSWKCVTKPIREVERAARMMREIYPTHQVVVQPAPRPHWVHLLAVPNQNPGTGPGLDNDISDCYDRHGNPALGLSYHPVDASLILTDSRWPLSRITQCEGDGWLFVTAKNVLRHYKETSYKLDWTGGITGGIQWFYYGPFRDNAAIIRGGAASGIGNPGIGKYYRGAIGLAVEDSPYRVVSDAYAFRRAKEILAHEVGHLIGRRHTNLASDVGLDANCVQAPDNKTDFPRYPDSSLWSGAPFPAADSPLRKEVGFHVKRKTVRRPDYYRDIMSYCSPKWITPFTYKKLHDFLDPPPPPPPGVEGEFWLISGFADEANVFFDAMYGLETTGHVETGDGTHRIEVRDGAGSVLFTRHFTPEKFEIDPPESGEVPHIDFGMFAEMVPVQAGAASIVVRNSSGVVIAELALEGAAPTVDITYPNGGEQLNDLQTITWTASDPDTANDDIFYWLHYSTDGGSNWISLVQDIVETSVEIDFGELPGSSNALLKVTASDGINSGEDTSAIFSVSRKMPTVEIIFPEHGQSGPVGETVFFEGYGYDVDSGKLPSYMHDWTSSRDGLLASTDRFSTADLSEGTHVITFTAIDADGNTATDSIVLTVGESSDSDGDGVDDAVDLCANTPMGEAVDGNGCSASQLDSDSDGVSDADDQCPGTPSGTAVDNNGCATSRPIPSASSGGGGGGFSFAWVFFLWYWALLQSRHGAGWR